MAKLLITLIFLVLLSGCLYSKVVQFQVEPLDHGIRIIDKRPDEEKQVRTPTIGDSTTAKKFWLGDKNFNPNRLDILAAKLRQTFPDDRDSILVVNKFEIVSFLPRELKGVNAASIAIASQPVNITLSVRKDNSNNVSDWIYGELEGSFNNVSFKSGVTYSFIYNSSEPKFDQAIHDATLKLIDGAIINLKLHNK